MEEKGHIFFISARDKYPAQELLKFYKIKYYNRGTGKNSILGKILYMIYFDFILLIKAIKFKPDILISFTGAYTTHVAKILNKPSLVFDDTDSEILNRKFYKPFATYIFTPNVFKFELGRKHIRFNGYMELAYLHPRYFRPNGSGNKILGFEEREPYVIMRFVNWLANHDYGHSGISDKLKIRAVKEFSKYAKVFITSEKKLPKELEPYRIKIPPEQMHEVLSSAILLYGESATMSSECAILGVPSIYIDNDGRSYTDEEEEKYGIVFNYNEDENDIIRSIDKGIDILMHENSFQMNRIKILSEKISFTDYIVWILDNYPLSIEKLKNDEKFQNRFIFHN